MKLSDLPNNQAILIIDSERKKLAESLWNEIKDESTPNFFIEKTVIDMDTVCEIISWANTPFNGEKVCLISFHTITLPAQNASLKLLEDIAKGIRFILITSNKDALTPTVLSRLSEIKKKDKKNKETINSEKFFKTFPTKRTELSFIKELLNKEDEEGRKDREEVKSFISELINFGRENNLEGERLVKLIEMESYAGDPSASGKMIIEFLSLYLPQIK